MKRITRALFRLVQGDALRDGKLERGFCLWGLIPLACWLVQAVHYLRAGQPGHLLWMCNAGCLVLALGMLAASPLLIRMTAVWMLPGFLFWLKYVLLDGELFVGSVLVHIGGLVMAVFALAKVRNQFGVGLLGLGWYLLLQLLARALTPAKLNVNIAFTVQPGFEHAFASYLTFWLTATMLVCIGMALQEVALGFLFPARVRTERN